VTAKDLGEVMNVIADDGKTRDAIVWNPKIRRVSFTGSITTGKTVSLAIAPILKKLTLELDKNDAFIVEVYADTDVAVAGAISRQKGSWLT
jgi:acyl-CoA reductase-like NAD-dependent aldehyde dehydrogenase